MNAKYEIVTCLNFSIFKGYYEYMYMNYQN